MPIKLKIDTLIELATQSSLSIKANQCQILMLRSEFCTVEHVHNADTRYHSECAIADIYKLGKALKSSMPPDINELWEVQQHILDEATSNREAQESIYILTNRVSELEKELGAQ